MIRIGSALTIACCVVLHAEALLAQNPTPLPTTDTTTSRTRWCFRGRPKPVCHAFWITEVGVAARVGNYRPQELGPMFTWELGWMVNAGTGLAFGVAGFAQAGNGVGAAGIRPRLRFWTSPTISLDLAPGIVLHSSRPGRGFGGHVGMNFADYAALTVHVLALPPEPSAIDRSKRTAVLVGGRLGSVPGALVGFVAPLVLIFGLLLACNHPCF